MSRVGGWIDGWVDRWVGREDERLWEGNIMKEVGKK